MKLNNFTKLPFVVLLHFLFFTSYGQSIKITSDLSSGIQFYNLTDVTQNYSPSFKGLISLYLSQKNFYIVASSGYYSETINFDNAFSDHHGNHVNKYSYSTISSPILLGFDITKFKLQPGIRTGIFIYHNRQAYFTSSDEGYSDKHLLTTDSFGYQYSFGLLIKYGIFNRVNVLIEYDYHWSIDNYVNRLSKNLNPSKKQEISVGLEFVLLEKQIHDKK